MRVRVRASRPAAAAAAAGEPRALAAVAAAAAATEAAPREVELRSELRAAVSRGEALEKEMAELRIEAIRLRQEVGARMHVCVC